MYQVYCDGELIHDLDSEFNVLISPTLNLELNKAPTFDFTMPPEHPLYDKIERFKSIIQVLQDGDEIFKGRAVQTQDDLYKQRYIYCEGELAYLNDTIQRPAEFHLDGLAVQRYFEKLLEVHNAQVDPDGKEEATPQYFRPGIVDIQDPNNYLYRYTNYNSTMDEMKEDLVDDYGGYLRVRNVYENNNPLGKLLYRYLDYVEIGNYGKTSEQVIEFGENLLDFTSDIDQANICTGIIPLGAILEEDNEFSALETRLTIEDANEGVDYLVIPEAVEKYGLILQTVTWDDVTDAENLKRKGELYLEEYDYDEMTITATAVDMHLTDEQVEAFRLGDMIFCRSVPHDLDRRFPLAQMEIPLDTPENTTVTLGSYQDASLTAKTNSTASGLRNFEDFQVGNVIKSAINQATMLIDMKTNGYVTLHWDEDRDCVDELLIMDTPDTSTATKVWRWNLHGLGYSSTGYSGDDAAYGTAITMDGHILGTLLIANGAILADDRDVEFAKFDDSGMKIYAQSGRDDLMLMTIGREGMKLYDDSGKALLADFNSDGITTYGTNTSTTANNAAQLTVDAHSEGTIYPLSSFAQYDWLRFTNVSVSPTSSSQLGLSYSYTYGIDATGPYITVVNDSDESIKFDTHCTVEWLKSQYMSMRLNGLSLWLLDENETIRSKMDYDSFNTYFSDGTPAMAMDTNGFRTYFTNGSREVVIDHDQGLRIFSNSDVERMRLNSSGYYVYDDDGSTLMQLSTSGFNIYNSDGVLRMQLSTSGLSYFNSSGDPSFKVDTNGTYYYYNANEVGYVGTQYYVKDESNRGLTFALETWAAFTSWGWRKNSSDTTFTWMLACFTDNCSGGEYGVNVFSPMFLNNYKMFVSTSSNSAYIQSSNDGSALHFEGDAFFGNNGKLYYNSHEVATKQDINNLSTLEARVEKLEAMQSVPDEPKPMYSAAG